MNEPRRAGDPIAAEGGWTDPETPTTTAASPTSAWESLTDSLGGLPHVLLRDTDADGESPSEPPSRPGSNEMPAPGFMPGRLQLLGEIARGGMGAILKGRDPDLCRDLAVKVLLEKHRNEPGLLCRFVEEAQIAGQLQHPGVVPVYRMGTLPDERPYFTMKLVKGRTLVALLSERMKDAGGRIKDRMKDEGGRMKEGSRSDSSFILHPSSLSHDSSLIPHPSSLPSDLPRFLCIFEQICRTIAYAHSRRVIHRDLKPSNIMVGGFGEVQVMDWGLAKVLTGGEEAPRSDQPSAPDATRIATARSGSAGSELSSAGSVIGTPAYMAPEQARGEISRIDTRADVFALGAILCEILTGRPPYLGRVQAEVQRKAMRGDLSDALGAIASCGADPELIAIARDCLAPEPEDRPAHAGIVADRVTGYLAGVEERLREAELERASEAARAEEALAAVAAERRALRLTVGLAASVLLLVGITGGGYAWLERERSARRAATARSVLADLERARELEATALAAPPDQPGPWPEALAAAHGAEDRLKSGEADEPLRQRVAHAVAAIEQGRMTAEEKAAQIAADRKLLSELESIRGDRAEHLDPKRTDAEYAAAFRQAGLDLDATDSNPAGEWIAARTAPAELTSFLDDWALVRRMAHTSESAWRRLVAAARAADTDQWRDALRTGLGDQSPSAREALRELAGNEEALGSQPVESLRLLARRLKEAGDREAAARVLRSVWRQRPDDFWVNFELARASGTEVGSPRELFPHPEEGARYLTAALAVRPGSAMAHHYLAQALFAHRKNDEAVAEWRTAIRLMPGFATAHNGLGFFLRDQGKLDEAIARFREAIRLKPDYALAHNSLGVTLSDQGRLDEAIAEFREAIRLQPDYAGAHNNLGSALRGQDKLKEAVAECREAIRLEPDDAVAHCNLGNALRDQGKVDEAITAQREAIRLQPDYAQAHNSLGLALATQGKLDEAIAEYREAIRLKPNDAYAHNNLGQALVRQGKLDEAITALREAIRLEPNLTFPHQSLGIALAGQGKLDEAVAAYREAIRIKPDDATAHFNLGNGLRDQGKLDEAIAEYRGAIKLKADLAEAHCNLGNGLRDQGKLDEAIAAYRKAIQLKPDDAVAQYNLGNALLIQGKLDEAIAAYREAIRLEPKHANAHANLGLVLTAQGNLNEALAELRAARDHAGPDPEKRLPGIGQRIAALDRQIRLLERLPRVLKGQDQPANPAEGIDFATLCYQKGLHRASARLYAAALKANPKLGDDRQAQHAYNAACVAALAGRGQGHDDPPPDEAARAGLRKQSLDWLKAELAAWGRILDGNESKAREEVAKTLEHWKVDTDLVGVRDSGALAKIPEAERAAWRAFWAEVESLLARARGRRR
jgi:serine/threonine-protein kinase